MQLCTARTAWSESDQAVRAVHSCNSWWLGPLWSDAVINLVSVLFGKCTTLVVTKFWPMETRLPCDDQWKAEKLGFWRWPITRCFIKSDRAGLFIEHSINFRLNGEHWRAVQFSSLVKNGSTVVKNDKGSLLCQKWQLKRIQNLTHIFRSWLNILYSSMSIPQKMWQFVGKNHNSTQNGWNTHQIQRAYLHIII